MKNDIQSRERAVLKDARRVVVKVGTHAIAKKTGRPDYAALSRIVSGICRLNEAGLEVIFVSSGAVAAGIEALGLKSRPSDVNDIQMCAAVGQARYITEYERMFGECGVKIGQVLLTHADFDERRRAANVRRMLDHLVKNGIVPVINENDVVADEEIKGLTFGDNDRRRALGRERPPRAGNIFRARRSQARQGRPEGPSFKGRHGFQTQGGQEGVGSRCERSDRKRSQGRCP